MSLTVVACFRKWAEREMVDSPEYGKTLIRFAEDWEKTDKIARDLLSALEGMLRLEAVKAVIAIAEGNKLNTPAYGRVVAARAAIAQAKEMIVG